jgi:uncharacterized protein
MLMTKKELQEELKSSMLAHNEIKTSVLRMLLSSIKNYEIQKGGAGYEASEDEVLSVIQKEAKQRRDSIEEYKKANRQELVDKEQEELDILGNYLPEQMSDDEVNKIIIQTISETDANSIQNMGKVMGALNAKLKGKADMGKVSSIVKEKLSSNE